MSQKKEGVLLVFLFLAVILVNLSIISAVSYCDVRLRSACTGAGESIVMGLSNLTNAHGQDSSYSDYPYVLCCDGGGSPTCIENNKILGLSSGTNAHAEIPSLSNYETNICYDNLECIEIEPICNLEYPIQTISLSSYDTNAHVGDFSAYYLKICCKESTTPQAYWTETDGTYIPESERLLIVTGVTKVWLFLRNSPLPNTPVKFEIYEDDGILDDNIKVEAGAITGTTDSSGDVNVSWTIEANDITNANSGGAESDYEFFFRVSKSSDGLLIATSGILNASVYGDEASCDIQCRDYGEDSCEKDPCSVSDESAEETFGITCEETFTGNDGCWKQHDCGECSWNAIINECQPTEIIKREPNCPVLPGGCPSILIDGGTCIANEDVNDDCSDGFLTYSWIGSFDWDGNVYNGGSSCREVVNGWVEDPAGTWHYDSDDEFGKCTAGAINTLECPSRIKLPFFSFLNLVIAALVIILVYVIINSKKKNSVKKFFRKKK